MYAHIFLNTGDNFAFILQTPFSLPKNKMFLINFCFFSFLMLYNLCCEPFVFWLLVKPELCCGKVKGRSETLAQALHWGNVGLVSLAHAGDPATGTPGFLETDWSVIL